MSHQSKQDGPKTDSNIQGLPGKIPSSIAALAAFRAFVTIFFFLRTSALLDPPTLQ